MFDNGATNLMSFGPPAPGNPIQGSFIASCRNQAAPQPLGKARRATYSSEVGDQQLESSIAHFWNNSSSLNSTEDIWKFSPSIGTTDLTAGSQTSSSPEEQSDPIFSLASKLTFNTNNNYDEFGRSLPMGGGHYVNNSKPQLNRQLMTRELSSGLKESLCLAFVLQQTCDLGEDCLYAHSVMELGKPTTQGPNNAAFKVAEGANSLGEKSGFMTPVSNSSIWFNTNDSTSSMDFGRLL